VRLDPGQFTTRIDNRWWPMTPGSRWTYRETDGQGSTQRVQVTVTGQTRTISGVQARVVHDVVTEDGQLVQNTYDWYAQDDKGNVWYLGEDTKEYEGGKVVSTEGSWEAGVDGAQPGILLPADPRRDMAYRQEYHKGQAEDAARVLSLDMRAEVPAGSFDQLLTTQDSTPLEPKLLEHKFYAPGWDRCWPSRSGRLQPGGAGPLQARPLNDPSPARRQLDRLLSRLVHPFGVRRMAPPGCQPWRQSSTP
jgi:hypothetical protein